MTDEPSEVRTEPVVPGQDEKDTLKKDRLAQRDINRPDCDR